MKRTISYAQNREDIILAGFLADVKDGFYVDVGANDPNIDSVTKYFYLRGWHGINLEPIRRHYNALTKERPRDINLNIGVSNKPGELSLREYAGSGLSTFSKGMQVHYEAESNKLVKKAVEKYKDYLVPVKTMAEIFKQQKTTEIHFMKVDVEGYEYEVLEGNDWQTYRPRVICIEANHINKNWRPLLAQHDYSLSFSDGLNEYYVDAKLKPSPQLNYVSAVIDREPIVNSKLLVDFEDIKNEAQERISQLEQEVIHLERYVQDLLHRLDDIASLRKHVRKVIVKNLRRIDDRITNRLQRNSLFVPVAPTYAESDTLADLLEIASNTDVKTAESYRQQNQQPISLRCYMMKKRLLKKVVRGLRHA